MGTGNETSQSEQVQVDAKTETETEKPSKTLRFTLEITKMDCLGCLAKVKRAIKVLAGVRLVSADHLRGVVEAQCDPGASVDFDTCPNVRVDSLRRRYRSGNGWQIR
jgi:copper chaperone CopZ